MKIGIISINMFSKGLNFACPLHNYAFQQFLLKNGIENEVLTYTPIYFNDFDMRHPYHYYTRLCDKFEKAGRDKTEPEEWEHLKELRDAWRELYSEREGRYDKFQNFIDTHYRKTDVCYDSALLEVLDPGFDCYICCTDVIWKKEPKEGFDRGFFLACRAMEDKWKISYAASRGVHHSETKADECAFLHYVKDIDAISVREKLLANYLRKNLDNEVTTVLDPVLLHEKEFYEELLTEPEEKGYIFLYYAQEKPEGTLAHVAKYARAHQLKIVEVTERPEKYGCLTEYEDIEVLYKYDLGIEEWLGYIRHADCVFTNSFHCCCFSILFEKQYFVGKRNGDKVKNLLKLFGLTKRRLHRWTDLIKRPKPDIDYRPVKEILKKERERSSDFILSAIRDMEGRERPKRDYDTWKKQLQYKMYYNSGKHPEIEPGIYAKSDGTMHVLPSGSKEFRFSAAVKNDGQSNFKADVFYREGYLPDGWRLRFKIDKTWFWYLEDGTFALKSGYSNQKHPPIKRFSPTDKIPYIPSNGISLAVAEMCWKKGKA